MFLSTQLRNQPLVSARLSQRKHKIQAQGKMRNYSHRKVDHVKNHHPKVEFRKVIIERGKNSRVREDQGAIVKGLNQSRMSALSSRKGQGFFANQSNGFSLRGTEENPQKQLKMSIKTLKQKEQNERKKFSFIQKLGNAQVLKKTSEQQSSPLTNTNQKQFLSAKLQKSRISSALSHKSRQETFKFIKDDLNADLQERTKKQDIQTSRILREDSKSARPMSSASNKSSFSRMRHQQREDVELGKEENNLIGKQNTMRSFYSSRQKKEKEPKIYTWQEVLQEFEWTERRINELIEQKWQLIEEKLTDEKQSITNSKVLKGENQKRRQGETKSLSRLSQGAESLTMREKQNEKYSFSRVVRQRNIDAQVMGEIKKLRGMDLSRVVFSEEELAQQYDCEATKQRLEATKQRLEQKRSQIIERALAQSMVEAQLLKKYYSGQNYNGLANSNYKVGQQNTKQKLILKLKTPKSTLIKDIKHAQELRSSEPRDSITKESESMLFAMSDQIKFSQHKEEDYQKFRYKHPNFKPNLQPFPQTSYRSQFFSYGNIQAYGDPYKEQQNIIFPTTNGLRNSSYRSEYKQMSPQRVNFRELDAYRDKYR